jgi:hypothetical protein
MEEFMQNNEITTSERADLHDTTMPLLNSMYGEFKDLAKKNPDSVVSKSKIGVVNRLLEKVRIVLEEDESLHFLDLLDQDDVPQVSDVTLMLSQYVSAMDSFKRRFHGWNGVVHLWYVE